MRNESPQSSAHSPESTIQSWFCHPIGAPVLQFVRISFVLAVYVAVYVLAFAAVVIPVVFRQFLSRGA